ncbi:hypothetical protein PoB_002162400 [Plakobranchus ocellatus]|uniref:Uncharacterized protein n=1 Tax=Plakobranchus ocellatus TaxID=259542 RepID=A0AAV3ZL78_9GAST|nr:hypothetical protein PoB_002162400 [Plakobranchus ocellatus]
MSRLKDITRPESPCQVIHTLIANPLQSCPPQDDLRLSGPPSCQGANYVIRTRDKRVPVDIKTSLPSTGPPTPPESVEKGSLPQF